jgi:hypothetical protein
MTTKKMMMGGGIHQMSSFNRLDLPFDPKQFAVAFGAAALILATIAVAAPVDFAQSSEGAAPYPQMSRVLTAIWLSVQE